MDDNIKYNTQNVTIGITAFNSGMLLKNAIDSVLSQTNDKWKCILILDGGCDKISKKIFDNFNHPKFEKHNFTINMGPYGTRAKAIELANTEWYIHLDGDDLLPKNAVEDILKSIKNNENAEYIYGNCLYFNEHDSELRKPNKSTDVLTYGPLFNAQSPIKISLFKRLGGFCEDLYINADWDFWITVYEKDIKGAYTDSIIYKRRYRKNNVGSEFSFLREKNIDLIIRRHPIFFNNEAKKKMAWLNYYEITARNHKAQGNRYKAYEFAQKAKEYGSLMPAIKEIEKEYKMSTLRYYIRRFARYI